MIVRFGLQAAQMIKSVIESRLPLETTAIKATDLAGIENEIQYNLQKGKSTGIAQNNTPALKALENPRLYQEQQVLRKENLD